MIICTNIMFDIIVVDLYIYTELFCEKNYVMSFYRVRNAGEW